jgi:hypothetical protein
MDDLLMLSSRSNPWTNVTSGLVGYWPMNEGSGTNTADMSGNGNTAWFTNAPYWTNGVLGNALYFNGGTVTGAYAVATNSSVFSNATSLTVCAWVKWSGAQANIPFVSKWVVSGSWGLLLDTTFGTKLQFAVEVGAALKTAISTSTYNDGAWHHACGVFDGAHVLLYVDGNKEVVTGTATPGPIDNTSSSICFGGYGNPLNTHIIGFIDDVRVYNRALNATEVWDLYNWRP